MPNPLCTYMLNVYNLFGLVLLGFIIYQTFGCYLIPNPLCTYIWNIYDFPWFDLAWFYYISAICLLFNTKFSLYIYIKYIWYFLVLSCWPFIVVYLMQNPFYTYISNTWFGLVEFYGISTKPNQTIYSCYIRRFICH